MLLAPIFENRQPVLTISAHALSDHPLVLAPMGAACTGDIGKLNFASQALRDALRR